MREMRTPAKRGFTLIEMVVVVAIIGAIAALALPELMPTLVFSRFDGAARHLAAYGRGAIAHACLLRQPVTVIFDLETQQYWTEQWVEPEVEEEGFGPDGELFEDNAFFSKNDRDSKDTKDSKDNTKSNTRSTSASGTGTSEIEFLDSDPIRDKFDGFVRRQLKARAKLVKNEGFLDEIGPLFEKEFTLEDEPEGEWQELADPVLERTELPEDVVIERIFIGSQSYSGGRVKVELSEVGLEQPLTIYVRSGDDYMTVIWNPITGGSDIIDGRADPMDNSLL